MAVPGGNDNNKQVKDVRHNLHDPVSSGAFNADDIKELPPQLCR
jgi:hypothetical protein